MAEFAGRGGMIHYAWQLCRALAAADPADPGRMADELLGEAGVNIADMDVGRAADPGTAVLLIALLALGFEGLRRRTAREFPARTVSAAEAPEQPAGNGATTPPRLWRRAVPTPASSSPTR